MLQTIKDADARKQGHRLLNGNHSTGDKTEELCWKRFKNVGIEIENMQHKSNSDHDKIQGMEGS